VYVESKLFNYGIGALILIILLYGASYYFLLKDFAYVPILILMSVTAIITVFANEHIRHYTSLTCMEGMMIGMTIGMMVGFMNGAIVGATNGMFVGSLFGMLSGAMLGFQAGRTVGIMGSMEGVMAGIMAGPMGAMTSVMMINDHLVEFLFILFGLCIIVFGGMSYMLNREAGPIEKEKFNSNFYRFCISATLIAIIFLGLMMYGPKGPVIFR
jgi:hypothetical protein